MPGHGLLPTSPPPAQEVLFRWLDDHNIHRSDALDIFHSPDSGWGVRANRPMSVGEISKPTCLPMHKTFLPKR